MQRGTNQILQITLNLQNNSTIITITTKVIIIIINFRVTYQENGTRQKGMITTFNKSKKGYDLQIMGH